MAFGNIAVDTDAFGPQGQGGLLSGMMIGAQMRQMQNQQAQQQREQQQEEALAGAYQGVDPNNPETLKPLYAISPLLAMKTEIEAANRRKALDEEKTRNQTKHKEAYTQWASSFANAWSQLPPDQRTPELANSWLDSSVKGYQSIDPEFAGVLANMPQSNPQWIEHAKLNGGFKDPFAQDQREVSKYQQQRQFDNQLPPTPYQREQIGLDQQRLGQSAQQAGMQATQAQSAQADGIRKEWNGLPEVSTLNTLLPMAQAARSAAGVNTRASNLDLIYAVAKVLDPMGVVRESDSNMVIQAGSPAERMRGLFSMVTGGGKLSDGQRGELLGIINNRETQARQAYDAKRSTYSGILKQRGIDPSMVFSEPMATGMQGGQQPVQQPAQQGGMSAPSGFSAPAPSRAGTPDDGYAQARALAQARPDKIPKIRAWLQQQGLDPSRL